MTISNMRDWVISAYPGDKWKEKVKKMPDDQIIPIYYRLIKKGRIKGA